MINFSGDISYVPTLKTVTNKSEANQRNLFYEKVMKWANAAPGENRAAYINRLMNAYDEAEQEVQEGYLDLRGAKFTDCPPIPLKLTELDLGRTQMHSFPERLPLRLNILHLRGIKQITTLPEDIATRLPNLTTLDIGSTSVCRLPAQLPPQLTVLDISNTAVEVLPENPPATLKELFVNNCEKLTLTSYNSLAQLPDLDTFVALDTELEQLGFHTRCERLLSERRARSAHLGSIYQQTYPRSCAAASLLVIAHELIVKQGLTSPLNDDLKLKANCESVIYKVTSDFLGNYSLLEKARGSLPPNIIRAARWLGLTETFFIPNNPHSLAMRSGADYPDVQTLLEEAGVAIHEEAAPELNKDRREIRFFTRVDTDGNRLPGVWDEMNHCVAVRPDGSCMDPGVGMNYNSVTEYLAFEANNNCFYEDTGMVIQFICANALQAGILM